MAQSNPGAQLGLPQVGISILDGILQVPRPVTQRHPLTFHGIQDSAVQWLSARVTGG